MTDAPLIIQVAPDNIGPIWDQVAPLLRASLLGEPTHTVEDIRRMLLARICNLWAQWRAPIVEAVVVTEFASYPQGVWLRVWLDGARPDVRQDDAALFEALEKWRRLHGCRGYEVLGRAGWLRRFPGLKANGLAMRWTIDDTLGEGGQA